MDNTKMTYHTGLVKSSLNLSSVIKLLITFLLFSKSTQSEKLMAFAKHSFDTPGKRIHLREFGLHNNKTFHCDVLLLYRQVMATKQ